MRIREAVLLLAAMAAVCKASAIGPSLDSCKDQGNTYRIMPNTACTAFTQEADGIPLAIHKCPPDMMFDLVPCVCVLRDDSKKCADIGRPALPIVLAHSTRPVPTVPSTSTTTTTPETKTVATVTAAPVEPSCGVCKWNGNVYRVIRGSGCAAFTEESADVPPRALRCPDGLQFDTKQCRCEYPEEMTCFADKCGVDVPLPQPSGHVPPSVADLWASLPKGHVGFKCYSHGNSYEVVANTGCKHFMQTTDTGHVGIHSCPGDLVFSPKECVCTSPDEYVCPDKAIATPVSPTKAGDVPCTAGGAVTCERRGVQYQLVPKTGCSTYTKQEPGNAAVQLSCAATFRFDLSICLCRYEEDFRCHDSGALLVRPPAPHDPTDVPIRQGNKCFRSGNEYELIPGTGCGQFYQSAVGASKASHSCPHGLLFDLDLCVCNFQFATRCDDPSASVWNNAQVPSQQPATASPATRAPSAGQGTCVHNGNVYGLVAGTSCKSFTQLAHGSHFRHECPSGLAFDLNICVCRFPEDFVCPTGGYNPSLLLVGEPATSLPETAAPTRAATSPSTTTLPPSQAPSTRAPSAGQGTCVHNGNVYGLVAGTSCRSFTQLAHGSHFRHECPHGLAFDLNICVCRFPEDFVCPTGGYNPSLLLDAPVQPVEPKTDAPTSPSTTTKAPTTTPVATQTTAAPTRPVPAAPGTCVHFDNVYTIVKGGKCHLFTQRTSDGTERIHACPAGLLFDLDICVCRYGYDFTCTDK